MKSAQPLDTPILPYNVQDTPWFFGAYLNMARHHAFLLVNHLTDHFDYLGQKKLTNDEDICTEHLLSTVFDPDRPQFLNDRGKVFKYLVRRHFLPLVRSFSNQGELNITEYAQVNYAGLHAFLQQAFSYLNVFRNSYSHGFAIENDEIIDNRSLQVSKEFGQMLQQIFKKARELTLERFSGAHTEDDFKYVSAYEIVTSDGEALTEYGLCFFICLFLDRGSAVLFLKKIRGFKNDSTPAFRATIRTFTIYCLRVPDIRLDYDHRPHSLLMEVLNELQRSPKNLYDRLSEEDKKIFISIDQEDDELISGWTSLIRHTDRFPYLALRAIDTLDLLPNLRFLIDVGRIEVDRYPKMVGGHTIERRLVKEVRAFGKLHEFEHRETIIQERLSQHIGVEEPVLFDQYNPHYHTHNHKIGFVLFSNTVEDIVWSTPSLQADTRAGIALQGFISLHELPKLLLLALLDLRAAIGALKKYASFRKRVMFEEAKLKELKRKMNPHSRDDFRPRLYGVGYINEIARRKEALNQLLQDGFSADQLPQRIQDYLLSTKRPSAAGRFYARIRRIKEENKNKLKDLRRSRRNNRLKLGKIADDLARDIIHMIQSAEVKDRVTSIYFTRLQEHLAYFTRYKPELITLLTEVGVFDPESGHPFLKAMDFIECRSLSHLYETYLERKGDWLHKTFGDTNRKVNLPADLNKLPYTYQQYWKEQEPPRMQWLQGKNAMPADLPIGIFDPALDSILEDKLKDAGIDYNQGDRFSVRLAKWLDNDTQRFYSLDRL